MKKLEIKQELINKSSELEELLLKAEKLGHEISKMWSKRVRQAEEDIESAFDNHDREAYTNAMADYNMSVAKYEAFKRITHDINDINLR